MLNTEILMFCSFFLIFLSFFTYHDISSPFKKINGRINIFLNIFEYLSDDSEVT